jgi:hypothetical protein
MHTVNYSVILFTYIARATNQYWQIERTPLRTESEHYSSALMSQSKIGNSCKAKQRLLAYKMMLRINTLQCQLTWDYHFPTVSLS